MMIGALGAVCEEGFARLRANLSHWKVADAVVGELVDHRSTVNFPKGAMVFLEGSPGDLFGCVLAGYVKVYCNESNGTRVLVRLGGPGDVIGYSDYVDAKGRRSKIFETQALTKCSIALFTREHVARLLRSLDADETIELYESLNTFWSLAVHWWTSFLGLPFQQRLEVVLADLARRVGVRDNRGTLIIPELSQADLAEMIASSRPLVSRLLNDMEERGLVQRHGKQYVLLKGWDADGRGYAHLPGPVGEELRSMAHAPQRRARLALMDERANPLDAKSSLRRAARNQ
jgi:CRP/FNR family transcriptional regulator, cyclic AMP receptor protein